VVVLPEEASRIGAHPVGPPCIYPTAAPRRAGAQAWKPCPMTSQASSRKQQNITTSRDLTRPIQLSILGAVVSARRRGLPGTSCGLASRRQDQPSQRAGWGATARVGRGLPAAIADPAGPRAGQVRDSIWGILTPIKHCATITFDRRSGMVSDSGVGWLL
jgi:hypothetical protein